MTCDGHIGLRAGEPPHAPQWGWSCGFYPSCDPAQHSSGTAETFEAARVTFERAWHKFSATRTEAHFELRRQDRDFHAWKDRTHDEDLPMPTQRTDGIAHCLCGAENQHRSTFRWRTVA